jgi:sugar lactone lactonase YvrE
VKFSNGIGLSPDGRRLYHSETLTGVFAYDILADGSLANRTLLIAQEDCDGLAVDREGGMWIACVWSGGIVRVLPDGTVGRRIPLPVKEVPSLCFGGADGRDVYVATGAEGGLEKLMKGDDVPKTASLYRGRSDIPGMPVPRTRFNIPAI